MDDIITVAEAAELTGYTADSIQRFCRNGWLKTARKAGPRVWLVGRAEIVTFKPGTRGWPPGVKRCAVCNHPLEADGSHEHTFKNGGSE